MPDGVFVPGPFVVKPETETTASFSLQAQSDILLQFHSEQAAAAIGGTENAAIVAFGDNDLLERKSGVV